MGKQTDELGVTLSCKQVHSLCSVPFKELKVNLLHYMLNIQPFIFPF